ncbi:MAG: hypothetical protein ACKVVT_06965 [Dehalococcoidia bacterium]
MAVRKISAGASPAQAPVHLSVASPKRWRERLWNLLPLSVSLFLATSLVWATYLAPWVLALSIVAFFAYWVVRSYGVAVACLVGMRRLSQWQKVEWRAKYDSWLNGRRPMRAWDWPRHLVIIPNYKEDEAGLARTLDSLAAQVNAEQLVVVMAMEEREPGASEKAARLVDRYRSRFAGMFSTFHPHGLPSETPGKGSNEAWAARQAFARLIDGRGDDLARYTITSCDADAVFHPRHFAALNYLFLTSPDPYRTFWEPAIFNSNNIWDIPAPLRMPDGLSGINRLSNLILPGSVRFPTSCYSLSWKMLDEVDYWDEEVIPEDWHLFLKCSYALGDRVNCQPLFLPLGNDCVLTDGWWKTIRAHYFQSVRHAWGATDIPYAWRSTLNKQSPLSLKRKLVLAGAVTKVHSLWMAQWYIVTMGVHLPMVLTKFAGGGMPEWWRAQVISLPGPSVKWGEIVSGDLSSPVGPWVSLTLATTMVYFCLFPLLVLIAVEYKARGPKPSHVPWRTAIVGFTMWPLMAVITFFLASMPALHAQLKLARGRGLVYRVAEKGSKRVAPVPVEAAESYGIAGGGGQ